MVKRHMLRQKAVFLVLFRYNTWDERISLSFPQTLKTEAEKREPSLLFGRRL